MTSISQDVTALAVKAVDLEAQNSLARKSLDILASLSHATAEGYKKLLAVAKDKIERLSAALRESQDEHLKTQSELMPLICVLSEHCGESGQNEGALETLKRIVAERDEAQLEVGVLMDSLMLDAVMNRDYTVRKRAEIAGLAEDLAVAEQTADEQSQALVLLATMLDVDPWSFFEDDGEAANYSALYTAIARLQIKRYPPLFSFSIGGGSASKPTSTCNGAGY